MDIPKTFREIVSKMPEATLERFGDLWLNNTLANKPHVGRSIFDARLKREDVDDSSALIVAHGPSLKRRKSLEILRESGYRGVVIAVDSAAAGCLRHGIIPDCIVCADPRPRIVHNFGGDEEKDRLHPEDEQYYKALGDESHLGPDPLSTSRTNRALFNSHGNQMIGLFSTSISSRIAQRCEGIGLEMYWWNPMYDDYDAPGSLTRKIYDLVPMPCVNAGGNVGTAAWVMAHSVFQIKRVGLVGFDFAYYADTPREKTQYYGDLERLFGPGGLDDVLPKFVHPRTGEMFFTDPAYFWFREVFLEMAAVAPCATFNCTEGGILFGDSIREMPLAGFLVQFG